MDPITLDPLCRLPYAPFGLRAPSGFMHYFDGRVLGSYLVSSGTFLNPMTGLPVARADCERLDAYLRALPRRLGKPCVTQVFDAKLRELQASEAREVRDLQVRRPVARRPRWGITHGLFPMPRPARPRAVPGLSANADWEGGVWAGRRRRPRSSRPSSPASRGPAAAAAAVRGAAAARPRAGAGARSRRETPR